jgi:hypothetical protein
LVISLLSSDRFSLLRFLSRGASRIAGIVFALVALTMSCAASCADDWLVSSFVPTHSRFEAFAIAHGHHVAMDSARESTRVLFITRRNLPPRCSRIAQVRPNEEKTVPHTVFSSFVQGDPASGPKRFAATTYYDANSRAAQIGTGGGVVFRNDYGLWNGALFKVSDPSGAPSYWQANARHKDGQIKSMNLGGTIGTNASAFQTIKTLDGLGRIDTIKTGNAASGTGATTVQNANYDIDSFGNLVSRSDAPTGGSGGAVISITPSESYQYDALNRVTGKNNVANSVATYDALGNIQTKNQSAAGTFVYETVGGAANYRLKTFAGRTYVYDLDGNVTSDGLRTIAYTPWQLPWRVTRGANSLAWDYDHSHSRTIEKSTTHGTTFFAGGGFERVVPLDSTTANPKTIERTYIPSPEGIVGVITNTFTGNATGAETQTNKTEYWHKDHIGSLVATTDQTGAITQRFRFEIKGVRLDLIYVISRISYYTYRPIQLGNHAV